MNRPPLEVADLVRSAGRAFIERSRRWITWQHLTVLRAIARCRTAALGGHLDECIACGYRPAISYNSCRNRHCPKCQASARHRWLQARRQELLPTRYVHVVFTLPHELASLALQNKKILYHLLLQTSAATLLEVARDSKHLGAEIGFFSVLHTWNQKLEHHPHVHCVVPAGGLSLDRTHWIQPRYPFFLPRQGSCAASCCTRCPKASSASAISASSPTAGGPLCFRFAIDYSTQNNRRNPNQKRRQPSSRTRFGSVPNVAAPW